MADADHDLSQLAALTARLREQEPQIGHLIAAIDFKRDLVEAFGPQRALELARPRLNVPGFDRLTERAVVPLHDGARSTPGYRPLWDGGQPFTTQPPTVVGAPAAGAQHGVGRAGWVSCLEDVSVRGRSSVVRRGDEALVDFERDELEAFPDHAELDPGVLYADGRTYWTVEPDRFDQVVDEAFMLVGSHANDFGHWLIETLPKLALARAAGMPPVPLLVDENMPPTHGASLDLLAPGVERIVVPHLAPCAVRRLWCAPTIMYRGYYPADWGRAWEAMNAEPERLAWAFGELNAMAGDALQAPTGVERLYLARRPSYKKRLVNHREIEAVAEGHGFQVVHPEDLAFTQQLRLAHQARFLVGPEGSNASLSYFGSPGARVCVLNNQETFPLVDNHGTLRAAGMHMTVFAGRSLGVERDEPYWDDYEIDAASFSEFLVRWTAGDDGAARVLGAPPAPA